MYADAQNFQVCLANNVLCLYSFRKELKKS